MKPKFSFRKCLGDFPKGCGRQGIRSQESAFALITTLLIIAVLTIMVVAFMQSMRIDRLTARSYLDKYRADLAARSAVNEAIFKVRTALTDAGSGEMDMAYTTELLTDSSATDALAPITCISRYSTNGTIRVITPLISTTNNILVITNAGGVFNPTNYSAYAAKLFEERKVTTNTYGLNARSEIQYANTMAPGSDAPNYYRYKSIHLNSSANGSEAYAYAVMDEQARINVRYHRSESRDGYATNANEVPVSLVTAAFATNDFLLSASEHTKFKNAAQHLESPQAVAPFFSSPARAREKQHLFGYYEAVNQDVIPAGYPDAGKPKYNINDLATNSAFGATATQRAEYIADIIDRNLPEFKLRDPSLASESPGNQKRYLNRLCASIVDYIDPDTSITTVNGGEPAGKDLFPMVTTVAEYFNAGTEVLSGGGYQTTISTRVYVQIWNPYTVTVTGSARILIKNRMRVKYGTGIVMPFNDYTPASQPNITVRPNEFVVVAFPAVAQTFFSPTGPNTTSALRPQWANSPADTRDQTTHVPFEFEWNGQRVDMHRRAPVSPGSANAGMPRNAKTLAFDAHHYQVAALPTYNHLRTVGDPRFTYLSNYDWGSPISGDGTYASSTYWKGRNRNTEPYNQNFVTTWALRDYIRKDPVMGNTPGNISTAPDAVPSPYIENLEGPNAPFYIRNGPMLSIGELGNIFDPIQADNTGAAPTGGTPGSIFVAGGGRTLRIGQPEFSYLDVKGKRAMQLLDLFTTNSTTGDFPSFKGRININTAPPEVLQALFNNIQIKADEGYYNTAGTIDSSKIAVMTDSKSKAISDAIVADRVKNGAYLKISDTSRLFSLTNSSSVPVWNAASAYQPNLGAGGANNVPEVMDRSREELFAKSVNLMDIQSRAFRVYATGVAFGPTGKMAARSNLEVIFELEQKLAGSGKPVLKPRIIYEKFY